MPSKRMKLAAAKEGVSVRKLYQDIRYAQAVDRIAGIVPGSKAEMLSGKFRGLRSPVVIRLATLSDDDIPAAYAAAKAGKEQRGGSRPKRRVQTLHDSLVDTARLGTKSQRAELAAQLRRAADSIENLK